MPAHTAPDWRPHFDARYQRCQSREEMANVSSDFYLARLSALLQQDPNLAFLDGNDDLAELIYEHCLAEITDH